MIVTNIGRRLSAVSQAGFATLRVAIATCQVPRGIFELNIFPFWEWEAIFFRFLQCQPVFE
jgi:hypothetical protein